MPWEMLRIGKNRYKHRNPETGKVYAKSSSKKNVKAQNRLLRAVKHGWRPTGKK